jgi:iron complex outermembrane receptor protein
VSSTDEYLQASWPFAARWKLELGVRHSSVRFQVDRHYIVPPNGDDSGTSTSRRRCRSVR